MSKKLVDWSAQFEWILNMINVGVHIVDRQGVTVFYNEMMADIDGLSREQVLGKNIFEVYPSLTDETSTLHLALQKGKQIVDKIQTYVNKQGKQITSINSTYPLIEDGQIIGAVEIAKDITKIMSLYDQVLDLRKQLLESKQKDKSPAGTADFHFSDLIGKNKRFRQALSIAKKAARTPSPVLIYGPTGTGKELVAQSIHNASLQREGPFIAQNCAAVPKELMEGLLFGTTKGAFTGSIDRPGIFEQADGGTLFLDELSSLELPLQAKLLRVLQDGKIRRIGGMTEKEVNVRIIAAMNIHPQEAMEKGILRSDLYYRLNVVHIELPPLAERKDDIPLLADHFIQKFNDTFGTQVEEISERALERLYYYDWPGNIRELRHAIESAFNLIDPDCEILDEHHFPPHVMDASEGKLPEQNRFKPENGNINLPDLLEEFERGTIMDVLEECKGNISKTAELLGLKRQALQYKLNKYGINRDS
ncbi:sigma-54 interaction domain-containing protein [Lihuaxuella thermophila]|uniref:Arginine utilization regulatory protein n=1 Tax=Lihuaxuella thermophila TaxID=1173111 RepID=A0A1H8IMT0_9BACL|nr:sigma 54-interacting transcriptional regulator [Lihuaxuella thermophila]SEN69336.1 arginine utilization regulatory protein [Lihuaxuella thermophila]